MTTHELQGVGCAPGRAAGHAWPLTRLHAATPPGSSRWQEDLELAVTRVRVSLALVEADDSPRGQISQLQRALLADPEFLGRARELVADGLSARAAIRDTVRVTVQRLQATHDPMLAARCPDIRHLGERLLTALDEPPPPLLPPERPCIVVAHDMSADELLQLLGDARGNHTRLVRAVLLERSGPLTHTAILARQRGIPLVAGVPGLLDHVAEHDPLLVDGSSGRVYLHPDRDTLRRFHVEGRARPPEWSTEGVPFPFDRDLALLANLDLPEEVPLAREAGADGVGLLRTDAMLDRGVAPSRQEQARRYRDALRSWPGGRVIVRMFDAPVPGPDPTLGPRGVRWLDLDRGRTVAQLDALLDAAAAVPETQLLILLPMVSSPAEVRAMRVLAEARWNGAGPAPGIAAMVETPAAALQVDAILDEAELVAVGSNDLLSLLVGASREDPRVAGLLDGHNPALWALLERIGAACRERGRTAIACGAIAAEPDYLGELLAMGYDGVSVGLADVARLRRLSGARQG